MIAPQTPPRKIRFQIPGLARKVCLVALTTCLFGWFYGWASPWAFAARKPGFAYGLLHGALMPLSLPSLVIGQNVQLYAPENSGCFFKISYICGLDVCGLIFIGPLFWRPPKPAC